MKIETQDYCWHKSCGCCTEFGTRLWINQVEHREFPNKGLALEYVLETLGHEVIELRDSYEDDSYDEEE